MDNKSNTDIIFSEGLTVREACRKAAAWLAAQAVEEADSNAELLLMHVLELDRAALLLAWNDPFPLHKGEQWQALLRRKACGEPIQYMIGEQWFYGRPFTVTPAVLIPRPETELLVEAVLTAADRLWPAAERPSEPHSAGAGAGAAAGPTVVDVGTGSGAIAVTLAAQRHDWRVSASDLSPDALEVARRNAARHGVADRVQFLQGDLLAPYLRGCGSGGRGDVSIDALVSNPPYIPAADLPGLQREVREFEPHLALDGGADGLDPYRRMLEQLRELPQLPRLVAFELGIGQPSVVTDMMREMGAWSSIAIIKDYAGIERHIIATQE
ncbi:peptide chain release factor N(5)-glutamine methyltransferase [Paenibacillus chungangensis]|uniref:Release factor glutamine methyltransferase n=1 Tax=Paenibacillus chungangensis TaxID=696535 RepID=A0ABW3HK07_9BACL